MAVAMAVLVSSGPATAAPVINGQAQTAAFYERWATYSTVPECEDAGWWGISIGDWIDFYCNEIPFTWVELWVLRPDPTPPPPGPVPLQTVQIQGGSGKCLDVQWRNSSNGTPLQLWGCSPNNPAQLWTIYSDGTIRALGKCMDIRNRSTSNGAVIHIWDCLGADNQKWESINVNGNTRLLRNPKSGRCVDAINAGTADGTRIQLYDCVPWTPAQQWTFIPPLT